MHHDEAYHLCHQHINRYVMIQFKDGTWVDGIIEKIEGENVHVAVPIAAAEDKRAFFPGFGFPGFFPGFGFPGFGFGFPFFRPRFRPFIFPFGSFGGLTPLPFFW